MKETDYQRLIIDYLTVLEKQNKLWFQRTNNTAIYDPVGKKFRSLSKGQKKGFPDIIVFMNGKTIGLEIKTPTGRQSAEQKIMEQKMKEQGAEYYVVKSLEEVKQIIEELQE